MNARTRCSQEDNAQHCEAFVLSSGWAVFFLYGNITQESLIYSGSLTGRHARLRGHDGKYELIRASLAQFVEGRHATMAQDLDSLIRENLKTVLGLEKELYNRFTTQEHHVHRLTRIFGRFHIFIAHTLVIAGWIAWNGMSDSPLDPWPHEGLILVLACESIALTLLVLITQRIMQNLDNHRAQLSLQIQLLNEQEATKTLEVLHRIEKHLGMLEPDDRLVAMTQATSSEAVSSAIQNATDAAGQSGTVNDG